MTMSATDEERHIPPEDPRDAKVRRSSHAFLRDGRGGDDAADAPDEERTPWNGDTNLQGVLERAQARREYALTQRGGLPAIDADGHVISTPEMLARQAAWEAEKAAEEAKRISELTPERLAAKQLRRWQDWQREYELHKPAFLRLSIGPRGEMLARRDLTPFEWEDLDHRHPGPEKGRVVVRGMLTPPVAEQPLAFANPRVLDAIREQLLSATWLPSESNQPTPPPTRPKTIDERFAEMAEDQKRQAEEYRRRGHNPWSHGPFGFGW